jgi:hypothetical protein
VQLPVKIPKNAGNTTRASFVPTSGGDFSPPRVLLIEKEGRQMNKWLAPLTFALVLGFGFASLGDVRAAAECKSDGDCASGTFCILAATPHVCKAPQAAGASCKRDVVCASKKCEIAAGQELGACK